MDIRTFCMGCMAQKGNLPFCPDCGRHDNTPQDSPLALPLGYLLDGRFLLGRVLGQGGFGITYLAWDLNLGRKLAIKEFFPVSLATRAGDGMTVTPVSARSREDFDYGRARFLEEGRTLARFEEHPGIASALDLLQRNDTAYLVMAYIEGSTLKRYLETRGGRIPWDLAFRIAIPVADALREVHAQGLLHRDISPDNIFLSRQGQVKILDFGAARYAMGEASRSLSVILKPGYAPEEQYRSRGEQGPWTDVYALAATLYRCLTGSPPPESPDRLAHDEIIPPSRLGVALPPAAEGALMKGLAVRARDRFADVPQFLAALKGASPIAVAPPPPPPPPPFPPKPRGWRAWKAAIGGLLAVLLSGGTYLGWRMTHEDKAVQPSPSVVKAAPPSIPRESPVLTSEFLGFRNEDHQGNYLAPSGASERQAQQKNIYRRDHLSHVGYKLTLKRTGAADQNLTGRLRIVFIKPDGTVDRNDSSSPADATTAYQVTVERNQPTSTIRGRWGYDSPNGFAPGEWKVEFYFDGQRVTTGHFTVVEGRS